MAAGDPELRNDFDLESHAVQESDDGTFAHDRGGDCLGGAERASIGHGRRTQTNTMWAEEYADAV